MFSHDQPSRHPNATVESPAFRQETGCGLVIRGGKELSQPFWAFRQIPMCTRKSVTSPTKYRAYGDSFPGVHGKLRRSVSGGDVLG
jgi:hypothetical protein